MQDFIEMSGDIGHITGTNDRQCRADSMLLAIESAKIGTFDWNMVIQEVIWNDYCAQLLGYRPTEARASYEQWESRVHPDDLPDMRAALDRAIMLRSIGLFGRMGAFTGFTHAASFTMMPFLGRSAW
jgi:PAS domain-containing protein